MCDTLYENIDNGELNGVVFLDIRKAFDSINHTILLHKMKVQFGITNVELDWFSSYLTNREQVCIVNGLHLHPERSFVVSRKDQFWVPYCSYCTLMICQIVLIKPSPTSYPGSLLYPQWGDLATEPQRNYPGLRG